VQNLNATSPSIADALKQVLLKTSTQPNGQNFTDQQKMLVKLNAAVEKVRAAAIDTPFMITLSILLGLKPPSLTMPAPNNPTPSTGAILNTTAQQQFKTQAKEVLKYLPFVKSGIKTTAEGFQYLNTLLDGACNCPTAKQADSNIATWSKFEVSIRLALQSATTTILLNHTTTKKTSMNALNTTAGFLAAGSTCTRCIAANADTFNNFISSEMTAMTVKFENLAAIAANGENLNVIKGRSQQLFSPTSPSLASTVTNDLKNSLNNATKNFALALDPIIAKLQTTQSQIQQTMSDAMTTAATAIKSSIAENMARFIKASIDRPVLVPSCNFDVIIQQHYAMPQFNAFDECLKNVHETFNGLNTDVNGQLSSYGGEFVRFATDARSRVSIFK
jgi:hypothetical protein